MALSIGSTYGRLTVLAVRVESGGKRNRLVADCCCLCGSSVSVRADRVGKSSNSCGCLSRELSSARVVAHNTKHGGRGSPEYPVWASMHQRCINPNVNGYENYGGRGVSVCERWKSFANFLEDMGPRPKGATLERVENNGNYEPSNCRWATREEQGNNKRSNRSLTYKGRTLTVAGWARLTGIRSSTIRQRLDYYGWSVADALTIGGASWH